MAAPGACGRVLDVSKNQLSGSIPSTFTGMQYLRYARQCSFFKTDSVSSCPRPLLLAHMFAVVCLIVRSSCRCVRRDKADDVIGPGACGSVLDVSTNQLSGSIPSTFSGMEYLWCVASAHCC